MNEILHANIFFIIASVATVCFCVLICLALFHLVKIMQSLRAILNRVEQGSEVIAEDLSHLRATIMEGGIVSRIIGLFFGGAGATKPKRKQKFTRNNAKSYGTKKTSEEDRVI